MTKYADRRFCICGHIAADHVGKYIRTTSQCMQIETKNKLGRVSWCQCPSFKLDNLKYLEQLFAEK